MSTESEEVANTVNIVAARKITRKGLFLDFGHRHLRGSASAGQDANRNTAM